MIIENSMNTQILKPRRGDIIVLCHHQNSYYKLIASEKEALEVFLCRQTKPVSIWPAKLETLTDQFFLNNYLSLLFFLTKK